MLQLVQYLDSDGTRRVGLLSADAAHAVQLTSTDSVYALMHRGLHERRALRELVEEFATGESISLVDMPPDAHLLPCFDHPVTASTCFAWMRGDPIAPLTLQAFTLQGPTTPISPRDAAPNALVYTVDIHQHVRLVGYAHVSGGDTASLGTVLHIADDMAPDAPAELSGAGSEPGVFETQLSAVAELRFGDVHVHVAAPGTDDA